MIKKIVFVAILTSAISAPGAFADSSTGAATDNKVAYQAAKQSYRSAMDTYKAQVANSKAAREAAKLSAKASISAAKTTYEAVKANTPTSEALATAKSTFNSAREVAKAAIPSKPVKPINKLKALANKAKHSTFIKNMG